MSAFWLVVMSAGVLLAIDVTWRYLERRGVRIGPGRRTGSTMLTAFVAAALVLVAWLLQSAGVLESTISSPGALFAVAAIVVALQVAFVIAFAILARNKSRQV